MSVMSMNSRMAMAEKLSVPQLQQAIQSGSLPAYIGVPLMETKMRDQQRAQPMQQAAPPAQPIAQEVMAQARGIESVPSNLPVAGYSYGGIVAFADGGEVDEDREEERDQAEYEALIQAYMDEANEAGLAGIPINRTKDVEKGAIRKADGGIIGLNNGGAIRFQSAGQVMDPYSDVDPLAQLSGLSQADIDRDNQRRLESERRGRESRQFQNDVRQREFLMQNAPGSVANFDRSLSSRGAPAVTPNPLAAAPLPSESPEEGASPVAGVPFTPSNQGNVDQDKPKVTQAAPTSAAPSAATADRPRSSFDDFMKDLQASREDLAKQKREDKYMALISAGLGMMGGTSPNAFTNIGQGAQAGVASYAASGKQRAAEKAAIDKNMLLSQRYQSMEDIAGRTADINEARYQAAAAARAAGGTGKEDARLDRYEGAITTRLKNAQSTVANALKAKFGDNGALINPKAYAEAEQALTKQYVEPVLMLQNQFLANRYPDLFGSPAPTQTPPANRPALSSFQRQ
jgi:hypothetical protein